ncbi:uncharacterized protein LOC119995056 isoform X1 [Tripterygium wilfordii]|uniref:uncharacterized protein LOC119995056 isoform X1 n=1 Tax=Tripterygium wilfordii TaxID=458696 RepID=UPI0018F7EF00|nr:uncharacterized protein LOC119995056 isoform X1 [Tripterygium wilfordii]
MPETIILITSSEEEEYGRDDAVKYKEEEDRLFADPTDFDNDKALSEDELPRRRKKRKRRKNKIKHYIEFHVAQAQLNVDNANHKEDNRNYRGVEMARVLKTEIPKKDEPQKLEVSPAMLKEQINAANVERAEALAAGNGANSVVVIDLSSSDSQSDEGNSRYCCGVGKMAPGVAITGTKKKKRRRWRWRRKLKIIKEETTDLQADRQEYLDIGNFMETKSIEIENNIVLRQLLRRPRYFDHPGSRLSLCLHCGEESHTKENCTLQKKKKPCYRCASFEHNGKRCRKLSQGYLNRKQSGSHSLEELHDQRSSPISCLRCGDSGHDMFSCGNDYSAEDLKEIQCYVCRNYGHLCCVDFPDSGVIQVSCYNCGQSGHLGSECTKPCRATNGSKSPALWYNCGQGGHLA